MVGMGGTHIIMKLLSVQGADSTQPPKVMPVTTGRGSGSQLTSLGGWKVKGGSCGSE